MNTAVGSTRLLMSEPYGHGQPSWSGDGRFVYLRSDRSGEETIYSTPAEGGILTPVVRNAIEAFESDDGQWLYYIRSTNNAQVFRQSLASREQKGEILPGVEVRVGCWGRCDGGLYFLHWSGKQHAELKFYDARVNAVRVLATLPVPQDNGPIGCSLRRDAGAFLWTRVRGSSDIHLIDGIH